MNRSDSLVRLSSVGNLPYYIPVTGISLLFARNYNKMNLYQLFETLIQQIYDAEECGRTLRKILDSQSTRLKLQRWVNVLQKYMDQPLDSKSKDKKLVHVLLNQRSMPIKSSKYYDDVILKARKELQEGDLLQLFYNTHDDLHSRDADIVLSLTDQEYQELLPTAEEKNSFFLCGIRIVRDNLTQYGEYITFN